MERNSECENRFLDALILWSAEANSATSNNMKLVHWLVMGGLLHLVQRGVTGRGRSPPSPLLAVPNVTPHPSTASVPITVLQYNALWF